jgi:hypothetical protein
MMEECRNCRFNWLGSSKNIAPLTYLFNCIARQYIGLNRPLEMKSFSERMKEPTKEILQEEKQALIVPEVEVMAKC